MRLFSHCYHKNLSFPQTTTDKQLNKETTVTCIGCGTKWEYDWGAMRMGKRIETSSPIQRCPVELARSANLLVR